MVETADLRQFHHTPEFRWLNHPGFRRIFTFWKVSENGTYQAKSGRWDRKYHVCSDLQRIEPGAKVPRNVDYSTAKSSLNRRALHSVSAARPAEPRSNYMDAQLESS
jgi:hypothetical protein